MRLLASLAVAGLCLVAPVVSRAESIYDFESLTEGSMLPLTVNVNGLTAYFTGGGAVCSSAGLSGAMFMTLSGNALVQGLCTPASSRPMVMTFSQPLSKVSFAVAINGNTPAPVVVTFLLHGASVGSQTVTPAIPTNYDSPEAAVSYSGATFDSVVVSSTSLLAIDNVDAVPR